MSLAEIKITAVDTTRQVVINGDDITHQVRGVQLILGTSEIPRVLLEFARPGVSFSGQGIVLVPDEGSSVADWLAGVDPHDLEQRLLDMPGFDKTTGAACIEILIEMAHART